MMFSYQNSLVKTSCTPPQMKSAPKPGRFYSGDRGMDQKPGPPIFGRGCGVCAGAGVTAGATCVGNNSG